jgi:hypothetical protein
MAATDLAVRIATIFDSAGVKKADKGLKGLEKSAKSLGKTLGITLGAAAMAAYGKNAVKAFAADQKSAMMLTLAVKNLGLAFDQANIDDFIARLEKSAGIADDVLRPALQTLLTTTGSTAKSQQLLNLAIEVSRGSGIALETVVQDLSNAYVGNTKGLRKYYLGLSQTQLKSMSFLDIQEKLTNQFSGSNAAYLSTYAGQMEVLGTAAGAAAEVIGQSLVEAIINVSGAADASTLAAWIESSAGYVDGLIDSIAKLIFSVKWLSNPKNWLKSGDDMWAEWDRQVAKRQTAAAGVFDPTNNAVTGYKRDEAARRKAEADAKKRAADLAKVTKANTAELKKQAALKKAGTVFDLEQIQLIAALKGKLSTEERMRVEAQLALLNENDVLAQQLTKQILMAQDETGNLYKYFLAIGNADIKNPFAFLDDWIAQFQSKLAALTSTAPNVSATTSSAPTSGVVPGFTPDQSIYGVAEQMISYNQLTGLNYNPNVAPVQTVRIEVTGEGALTDAIASSLQTKSLSDGQIAYLNRRTGFFE